MPIELSDQVVSSMAPSDKALLDGRGLIKKGSFRALSKNEDGTLVFAECKGSAAKPYQVSFDLDGGSDRPTVRCSCPSQLRPCKHGLGLMLAFVARGADFKVAQPPADLLEKRTKLVEKRAKAASSPAEQKPREVNKNALAKKNQEQVEALETLEKFVVDLVSAGLGGLNAKGVTAIGEQAKRMRDAQLYGAQERLIRLADLGARQNEKARKSGKKDDEDEDDELDFSRREAVPYSDQERQTRMATLITQLWVTVRKGKQLLEGKLEEGESKAESDAQDEALLGRIWNLADLKAAGYWTTGRAFLELSHEEVDDRLMERVSADGFLLDLGDGAVHVEHSSLPYQALVHGRDVKLRASRAGVVEVKECALYPGDRVNRRVRWNDKEHDIAAERPRASADYARVHALARPIEAAVKALREQMKNPLSPQSAVALLSAAKIGLGPGGAPVIEDASGARLPIRDPREAFYPTSRNFAHAAGAFGPGSVAVRLWFDPSDRAIWGQALAHIAGDKHIRLGLLG